MKINAYSLAAGITLQPSPKGPGTEKAKTSSAPSSEPAAPISQAQQALRDLPETDNQRVAELKAAISLGKLDLDPESLSHSMMDYYRR